MLFKSQLLMQLQRFVFDGNIDSNSILTYVCNENFAQLFVENIHSWIENFLEKLKHDKWWHSNQYFESTLKWMLSIKAFYEHRKNTKENMMSYENATWKLGGNFFLSFHKNFQGKILHGIAGSHNHIRKLIILLANFIQKFSQSLNL